MRVVIAEDSVLLREGIVRLLEEQDCTVVAAVGDGDDLLKAVGEHRPDVCVVDVRMPPTFTDEGLRAALVIREQWQQTGVLVLSQFAGAAHELTEALIVNPFDPDAIADAMHAALNMPLAERSERHAALKAKVFRTTASAYCQRFLDALHAPPRALRAARAAA